MSGAPDGTVTVLFTDLVGSASLADRLGDDVAQTLRRAHARILQRLFERFDASLIKGTGDGFMVAFSSARRAVECAAEVQRAIAAQHEEGRYRELAVRVGIHTGEPVAQGGDLLGSDVDLAARITSEARGGQVLVSDVTRALARHSSAVRFEALGERALKGFAEPATLFEVLWEEARSAGSRPPRFVGRSDELVRLRGSLEAASREQGSLVLAAGEPGVGKTRLASELAIEAADRGFQVLTGHAYETAGMPPYLPFAEALKQYTHDRRPAQLWQKLGSAAPQIAKILPELRDLLGDIPEPEPLGPEAERYRLFEGISDLLLNIAADEPLLLFLDDLHWADESSVLLLRHLARRLAAAPMLVVGTYRDAETGTHHPLTGLLAELSRQQLGYSITLRPFNRDEAATLIEAVGGRPPTAQIADALYAIAEGNPFFTEEMVRHLQEEGRDLADPRASVADWAVPETVRQVISNRLARLPPDAGRVLAYSSVLGRDLSVAKVATVAERDEDVLIELLDAALATGLLCEADDGYVFAHPLIQETLYQSLSAPRRGQLHRRVAEALEELYGPDPQPQYLAELAHHFSQAAPVGEVDKTIEYATGAAKAALSQLAYEEAAGLYLMACRALEMKASPDERQRCELLLCAAEAYDRGERTEEADGAYLEAVEIARTEKLSEQLARAALGFSWVTGETGANEDAIALLEEALDAFADEDSELRARLMGRLAASIYYTAPRERRAALSQQAVEMSRRIADPATLAYTLYTYRHAVWGPDNVNERLAATTELVRLAEQVGDWELAARGQHYRAGDLLELGDTSGMEAAIQAHAELANKLRQPGLFTRMAVLAATRALVAGRFAEAEHSARQALEFGERAGSPGALMTYAMQVFAIRRDQGRLQELEGAVQSFVEQFPALRWLMALAYLHSQVGREDEARREFEGLAANDFSDIPCDMSWLVELSLLAEICACLRDTKRAQQLYRLLEPYATHCVVAPTATASNGAVSRHLGLLAATMERWGEAERHFEAALDMNARMGARPFVAHTQHDYARMLLARGGPGDQERAHELLGAARDTAQELGMSKLVEQVCELAHQRN